MSDTTLIKTKARRWRRSRQLARLDIITIVILNNKEIDNKQVH